MAKSLFTSRTSSKGGVLAMIAAFLFTMVVSAGFSIIVAFPVLWLWNGLMPDIFGLPSIEFMQAWGLCVLANLLVKSSS